MEQTDNTIVETETTVVDETVATPTDEPIVKEEPKQKLFTQDEVNKFVNNRVYSERDSIAKKLGIGDKYSAESLDEFIANTSELKTMLEATKSEVETITTEKNQIQEDYLINKFNVDESLKNDFLTLVKSNLTADKTMEQSASEVQSRLKGSNMFGNTTPTKVVIGTDKTNVSQEKINETQLEALRKL